MNQSSHFDCVLALQSEDLALKHQLELYVERIQNYCPVVQRNALQSLGNLAGEIPQEYVERMSEDEEIDDLMKLVEQVVAFHMKHNTEHEAVDLLM
ncbi:26S proteasome non-ATPase regulatory subunit 2 homolog A-like isoform X2 [Quercus lobata]|uniref:RPN1 N-terminal domain-containing protein n=2 Tax=Quercus lobata TaxID=97700 RepID=A0A7N2ME49_QUELO|nr:26S proteasome non-ATPase regulatory subunit 2 homolog A-like isoform X2 [Quercus lobata]